MYQKRKMRQEKVKNGNKEENSKYVTKACSLLGFFAKICALHNIIYASPLRIICIKMHVYA